MAVCRPPSAPEAEIEILPPTELPDDAADADLLRDVCAGQHTLRLPMYGHHGADASQLCAQEVAPLLDRLSAGESSAVIAYGQTGAGKSFTMGTERYEEGQGPAPHSGERQWAALLRWDTCKSGALPRRASSTLTAACPTVCPPACVQWAPFARSACLRWRASPA